MMPVKLKFVDFLSDNRSPVSNVTTFGRFDDFTLGSAVMVFELMVVVALDE